MNKKVTIIIISLIIIAVGIYLWNSYNTNSLDNSFTENQTEDTQNNFDTSNMNILIAYYSYSDNTETMAQEIQNQVGGDLFIIERKEEYNDLYTETEEEINNNERPELSNTVENIAQYDVIFIGFPIWWNEPPAMINSFLESYDLSNKIVIPFCTSSSDGIENSMNSIRSSAIGADVLEGLRLSGNSASSESGKTMIEEWLTSLDIFSEKSQ